MYAAAGNLAARPLTLEIFPSWPMSHLQQPYSVSTGSVSSFTVAYSFLLTTSDKGVLG
jgi:transcription factor TGA